MPRPEAQGTAGNSPTHNKEGGTGGTRKSRRGHLRGPTDEWATARGPSYDDLHQSVSRLTARHRRPRTTHAQRSKQAERQIRKDTQFVPNQSTDMNLIGQERLISQGVSYRPGGLQLQSCNRQTFADILPRSRKANHQQPGKPFGHLQVVKMEPAARSLAPMQSHPCPCHQTLR